MREIVLAKSAGFCYGVRRAVELAEEKAAQGIPCVMLGSIIHNRDVTGRLAGQTAGHIPVVDDGAQHDAGDALSGFLLRQLHGAAHAVAEAGGLCQHNFPHSTPSPRARTRSIRFRAIT